MKSFKQIVENIVVLDEAVMDQKMWDQTKKGDKLTISYDSGIKKGNKTTFVVGTKNVVGKARVGKITMKRDDGKGGKFFLYNRNGNISLALGDMAASMTGLVKESVEVELDEMKQGWALIDTADGNKVKALSSNEQGVKMSRATAERPPMSVKDKNTLKVVKLKKAVGDKKASFMIGSPLKEEVELDERNYAKEYANYHSRPEQIANRSSRNQARRIMAKDNNVEGMDVGHKDNNPLNNDPKNLQVEDPSDNRREPRLRNEGTWAIPDTPKKKMTLKKILSRPLKAKDAEKAMYNIIGDDELFDAFDEAKPNEDVRSLIKSRMKEMGIKEEVNEGKQAKYPLYHKDFSGAMKTAYDHAKKNLGVIVDPSEIDDKVAMGPRKPSTGKTNSYRLTDKSGKKAIQVQVYNTGKSYELNMYKEDLDFVYEAVVTYEDDDDTIIKITIEKDKFMYAMGRDKPQDIAKRYPWKNGANSILEPTMYKRSRSWDDVHQYLLRFLGNKRGMDSAIRQVFSHNDTPIIYKEEVQLDEKEYNPYAKSTKRAVQQANANKAIAKARNDAVKTGREVDNKREYDKKQAAKAKALADRNKAKSDAIRNEEVQLDEAFKAGGLKLKDGKQVLIKKDDAKMLNDLMKQLSKPNVKKMTDTAMKNKKGYEEILGFARDSHE